MQLTVEKGYYGTQEKDNAKAAFLLDKLRAAAETAGIQLDALHERVEVTAFMDGSVPRLHATSSDVAGASSYCGGGYGKPDGGYFNRTQIAQALQRAVHLSEGCHREDKNERTIADVVACVLGAGWAVERSPGAYEFTVESPGVRTDDERGGRILPSDYFRLGAQVCLSAIRDGKWCSVPIFIHADGLPNMTVQGFLKVLAAIHEAIIPDDD